MPQQEENNKKILVIVIVVIIILVIIYWLFRRSSNEEPSTKTKGKPEGFGRAGIYKYKHIPQQTTSEESRRFLVDMLPCHPDCCGKPAFVDMDGLTSDQIQERLISASAKSKKGNTYIRTNYMCGNGKNGIGCPCITKETYWALNRNRTPIEPTYFQYKDIDINERMDGIGDTYKALLSNDAAPMPPNDVYRPIPGAKNYDPHVVLGIDGNVLLGIDNDPYLLTGKD